jgi:hypothetical protein
MEGTKPLVLDIELLLKETRRCPTKRFTGSLMLPVNFLLYNEEDY